MRKFIKINIIFVVLSIFIMGCDSFLDVKSDATLVVPNSLDDLQAILDAAGDGMNMSVPSSGDSMIDDYYLLSSTLNSLIEDQVEFYKFNILPYNGIANDWARGYVPIMYSNLVLDQISKFEKNSRNSAQWDQIKGSALFYRSFYLFNLLVIYGPAYHSQESSRELGVVIRNTSNFNVSSVRSTVEDCIHFISSTLEEAIDLLPNYPVHVMRPSKGAALALLARVYLYKSDYEKAAYYSGLALDFNDHLIDFNGDSDLINISGPSTFRQFNKETIFYAQLSPSQVYSNSRAIVDSSLYDSFKDNDLRKVAFFNLNNNLPYFKGSYTGNSLNNFGGLSSNEQYLIRAESLAKLGKIDEAKSILANFLVKRYNNKTSPVEIFGEYNIITDLIREERRKELLFRGLRFYDIKRYNRAGAGYVVSRWVDGVEYRLEPNSNKYALPLPEDLVKLTGMPQNIQ